MTTYAFTITGMHCASCGMLIDETLEDLPGVRRSDTSQRLARTTVQADPGATDPDTITAAIAGLGYQATLEQP